MKSLSKTLFCLLLVFSSISALQAQTFVGAQIDNRAGIRGLTLNPANVVNPRLKAELNLFSVSAFLGNDYVGLNLSDLSGLDDGLTFDENLNFDPKPDNNFVGNVDVLGPSFQINLSEKHSLALSTRARGFFNLNNIGGELYETITDAENAEGNYAIEMENVQGIVHVWGEIGLTYGRVLMNDERFNLKGAVTLKYLAGAGGAVGSSEVLGALFVEQTNTLTTRGQLKYGYSDGFDSEDVQFEDITSGFGADLGFIFEWKDQSDRAYTDGYKFRGGISIMDIGGIKYSGFDQWNYDMNNTISGDEFEDKDLEEVLEDNYTGTQTEISANLGMPTSLQIFGDYAITNKFYISAHGSVSLRSHGDLPVSQVINNISLTPRFESGWISVYSPLSFRQYEGGISWGLGLRLGPVILGSGSILTNVLSNNSRSTDAYLGLQIPFYKKGTRANNR
ncbi:hypothetical protein [Algoriphagus namhaensis]